MPHSFDPFFDAALSQRENAHQLRRRKIVEPLGPVHVRVKDKSFVNFCSNNYLGLTHHPRIVAALRDATAKFGAGAGAAGLISGYSPAIASAEKKVAEWKGAEAAVLLPSGCQANHAAIQTLAAIAAIRTDAAKESAPGKIRFLVDKLAHASLLDAVRATAAPFRIFPHNGLAKLQRLLEESSPDQLQVVVTESIFSMDGDSLDLRLITQLKPRHNFLLLLDEAHASGVYGPAGSGWAAEHGLANSVDISIATLSKAAGVIGGAICGSQKMCDAILNFGRAYIYSTSIPPAIAAAIEASIDVMREEPQRQARVRAHAIKFRKELAKIGLKIPPGDSPIIPLIVGEEARAMEIASRLEDQGLLVQPVRPPTVPPGTSRLRITLSSEHSSDEIEQLIDALKK
jgi:8-amino-7-oxononanoate synthase